MTPSASTDASSRSPDERRNIAAVTDVLPYWNHGDIPGVLSYYDDRILWTNVAMEEAYAGKGEVGAYLQRMLTAFPGLRFEVTHKIPSGQRVAERWIIHGTHDGPYLGIPPTGKQVAIHGMSIVHLPDGKFVSDRFYFDTSSVLRDMGLFPPPAVFRLAPVRLILALAATIARFVGRQSSPRQAYDTIDGDTDPENWSPAERANLEVLQAWITALNERRFSGVRDALASEVRLDNKLDVMRRTGRETISESIRSFSDAFPDAQVTVVQTVVRDDTIACEFHVMATHTGEFLGVPATGLPISIPAICMLSFGDGHITDIALYADSGMLWRQLGLMPPLSFLATPMARVSLWAAVNRVPVAVGVVTALAATVMLRRSRRR